MADTFPQPPFAPTVSKEAREQLEPLLDVPSQPQPDMSVEQMRQFANAMTQAVFQKRASRYPTSITPGSMGGVPVQQISKGPGFPKDGPLLINFHGGGFVVDSGSLIETTPITFLTGLPVVAVLYRLAPEQPYPAAVDDALSVYKAALKTRSSKEIAIFGTSAGAGLCAQLLARLKREGLPVPAGVGFFSGSADTALPGDIEGYLPRLLPNKNVPETLTPYVGKADRFDPLVSPLYGPLDGMPPMLLMSGTRDLLLSQTVRYHLALRKAGNPAELFVYEGMPHAFWAIADCPETDDALKVQADFLKGCVVGEAGA